METKHINEEQIAMVADALNAGDVSSLPADVKAHIAKCDDCANKALIVSELTLDNNSNTVNLKNSNTKNPFLKYYIYAIAAASIIILFLVFYLQKPIKVDNNIADSDDSLRTTEQVDTNKITPQTAQTVIKEEYIDKEKLKKVRDKKLVAFVENRKLEDNFCRFSNSEMRSIDLNIISNQTLKIHNTKGLKLEWTKPSSPIIVELFNNKGEKIMSKETNNAFVDINSIEKEGLYYWKLLDEDYNIIYCGKIIYRK